jgi:hypothetical protein
VKLNKLLLMREEIQEAPEGSVELEKKIRNVIGALNSRFDWLNISHASFPFGDIVPLVSIVYFLLAEFISTSNKLMNGRTFH